MRKARERAARGCKQFQEEFAAQVSFAYLRAFRGCKLFLELFAPARIRSPAPARGCGQVVCLDSFLEKAISGPYNAFLRLD